MCGISRGLLYYDTRYFKLNPHSAVINSLKYYNLYAFPPFFSFLISASLNVNKILKFYTFIIVYLIIIIIIYLFFFVFCSRQNCNHLTWMKIIYQTTNNFRLNKLRNTHKAIQKKTLIFSFLRRRVPSKILN